MRSTDRTGRQDLMDPYTTIKHNPTASNPLLNYQLKFPDTSHIERAEMRSILEKKTSCRRLNRESRKESTATDI